MEASQTFLYVARIFEAGRLARAFEAAVRSLDADPSVAAFAIRETLADGTHVRRPAGMTDLEGVCDASKQRVSYRHDREEGSTYFALGRHHKGVLYLKVRSTQPSRVFAIRDEFMRHLKLEVASAEAPAIVAPNAPDGATARPRSPRDATRRKMIGVITKYVVANFSSGDWITLGQMTGHLSKVQNHPRLLSSLGFGDDDYAMNAAETISEIFETEEGLVDDVIDYFDMDLWCEQTHPEKYRKLFGAANVVTPEFWKQDCLRVFCSHLSTNRQKAADLKSTLKTWGISTFLAHQDIEPTKEWQAEIESALATMDVLVALIEPGFRESAWTDQEVGYALGRGVDVVPLLIGVDPHGFLAKIQGIPVKGKIPSRVADDLALVLVKRPKLRDRLLNGLARALVTSDSLPRRNKISALDNVITRPRGCPKNCVSAKFVVGS